jgi:hypothetical protein
LHLLEFAGLIAVGLLRQTGRLPRDGFLTITRIGVVGEELRTLPANPAFG